MRRFSLPIALVLVLVTGVAFAVKPTVSVLTLAPLSAGGPTGEFRVTEMKNGDIRVQGHIDNLDPSQDYISTWSAAPTGCLAVAGTSFVSYRSNPQGKANFNEIIASPGASVAEIQVVLQGTVLQACAQ